MRFQHILRLILAIGGIMGILMVVQTVDFLLPKKNTLYGNRIAKLDNSEIIRRYKERYFYNGVENESYEVNSNIPRFVIIFATARTGSSFFGEMFNQNKDVFYSYEPLHPFYDQAELRQNRLETLQDLSQCNFQRFLQLYKHAVEVAPQIPDGSSRCAKNGFCFSFRSKAVFENRHLCPEKTTKCNVLLNTDLLSSVCKSKKLNVAKIIAVPLLEHLQPLSMLKDVDIKIIHLVRDPRGILSSRIKQIENGARPEIKQIEDLEAYSNGQTKYFCNPYKDNIEFIQQYGKIKFNNLSQFSKSIEPWQEDCNNNRTCGNNFWNKNYMLVRYEDISLDPLGAMKGIYDFVGMPYSNDVKTWIEKNTKEEANNISQIKAVYSTKKNSSDVTVWKKHLPRDVINITEKNCRKPMKYYGYEEI